jgi:hypothetical protein
MATEITITAVQYANTAAGVQTWSFFYKLYSASSWKLISNSASVNTDGTLGTPLNVTGLTAGQLYYIQSYPNCSSPLDIFIEPVQL